MVSTHKTPCSWTCLRLDLLTMITQSCPTFLQPHGLLFTRLLCPQIPQARILEWVAIPSPGDLPNPGIEPGSPALQEGDSLPSEPPGKCIPYRALGAVVLRLMLHSSIAQILPVWVYTAVNRSVCPHGVHIPGGEADKEGSNKSSEEQLRSLG